MRVKGCRSSDLLYLFDTYVLDAKRRELRRSGTIVPAPPQVFDVLEYLIRNRDRVVSRDDLIGAVWGGRVISESALATRINAVRSTIGDNGEKQHFIKTLPRKGFRFVADVQEQPEVASGETADVAADPQIISPISLPGPSIAVLPFANLGADKDQDFLCDGIVEDIITMLSQISGLFVIARNSTFAYKGKDVDVRDVGRQLGVRYIMEGSVRHSGDRLRVTAQLIDSTSGAHVWAERYDRRLQDVFEIQDELTKEIVTALRVKLTDGEQARIWLRSTTNFEAWSYATRGVDYLWRGTSSDMTEARNMLERALACDATYARAAAFIALTYYFDARFNYASSKEQALRKHAEFTRCALEINPEEPYAILMRSGVRAFEGCFDEALKDVKVAVAKSPGDAYCWCRYARILNNVERTVEGERAIRHAMQLNPIYPISYETILGDALLRQRRLIDAIEVFKQASKRQPKYLPPPLYLASAYSSLDDLPAAHAAVAELLQLDPSFDLRAAESFYISSDDKSRRAFLDSLRRAGLPG
jgi:TolB-like protein